MAEQSRAYLKGRFNQGAKPTYQDWIDLLDSFKLKSEELSQISAAFNQLLAAYDNDLKSEADNGVVDTLGDLFKIFQGWDDSNNVKAALDAIINLAKWSALPGKPSTLNVDWNEQVIDITSFQPLASGAPQRWLLSDVGNVTGKYVIIDLFVHRFFVGTGVEQGRYEDCIWKVKIGITPRISLV